VVPVENSTEGVITHTLDNFVASPLHISGEVKLRIHHHLLVKFAVDLKQVTKVFSHQQSLAQCRKWLDSHCSFAERIAVSSNAEAARRALAEPGSAAIAGDMAAEQYGLIKMIENIEDQPDNTTSFLIIGRQQPPPSGDDKTSILVSARNQPGALYHVLEPFHRNGISLTRIETRPSTSGTWAYVFYIDFEGHIENEEVKRVVSEISRDVVEIKHLGSYPIGVL
jgi:chorismate mutase/prephenate dehydratase